MEGTPFSVHTSSGELSGWVTGDGPPVLAVHGGPGMSCDYLNDAVVELANRYQVAIFQQRGLPPSTEQGEFTVAEAVADIEAVLDGLGWRTAYLMGHSWGGHLVFHAAAAIPDRLAGVLSVDPLGAVGDGGAETFGAEMLARVPAADRERARELDEKDTAGESTPEEDLESFSLFWPSYFADPPAAPAMPRVEFSRPANQGLWADLQVRLPELESLLPTISVPFGVLVGELSPMPPSVGTESAERIPGAWSHVEPGAGHFVWHEAPGCLLAAMDRLAAEARYRDDRALRGYEPLMDSDRLEAIQNVVDRVSSYQDGAPEGTVEGELRRGLDEAGIELEDQEVDSLASAIEDNAGEVTVSDVLE